MINKDSSQEPTGIKQTFVTKSLVCFITAREHLKNNIGFLKKKKKKIQTLITSIVYLVYACLNFISCKILCTRYFDIYINKKIKVKQESFKK